VANLVTFEIKVLDIAYLINCHKTIGSRFVKVFIAIIRVNYYQVHFTNYKLKDIKIQHFKVSNNSTNQLLQVA
jgi:hypothetical protein